MDDNFLVTFLAYLAQLPNGARIAFVLICLCAAWGAERGWPRFQLHYDSWWIHARTNLALLLTTIIIGLAFATSVVGLIDWSAQQQIGLLHWLQLPLWAELLIALLVLDFMAQYWVHALLHKVRWMWRLHLVHHSDNKVDATTGTRHHPGDYLFREVFALLAIALLGLPLAFYLLYRFITIPFTYFIHANLRLPKALDRWLSWVFVTPDMHKFHHHNELPWTDSNYGGILSIWDRLFGTFTYADVGAIRYGINVLDDEVSDRLGYQLVLPFRSDIKSNAEMQRSHAHAESVES